MSFLGALDLAVVAIAVIIDFVFGEVPNSAHPVVGMGKLAQRLLRHSPAQPRAQLLFGAVLVFVVAGASTVIAYLAWLALYQTNTLATLSAPSSLDVTATALRTLLEGLLLSTLFALRGLIMAGKRMRRELSSSLTAGRAALCHLCSRDPSALTETELCAATVESLSENSSDSFVAPLFWYVLVAACGGSGLCGAAFYRAVNTLDAMVGYRGKYEYIGKPAAKLDDVLNWIPARITAGLVVIGAMIGPRRFGFAPLQSLRVLRRDHALTASPNAGWPMAAAAGALQVALAKRDHYTLGAKLPDPTPQTIHACERLVILVAMLWLGGVAMFTVLGCRNV